MWFSEHALHIYIFQHWAMFALHFFCFTVNRHVSSLYLSPHVNGFLKYMLMLQYHKAFNYQVPQQDSSKPPLLYPHITQGSFHTDSLPKSKHGYLTACAGSSKPQHKLRSIFSWWISFPAKSSHHNRELGVFAAHCWRWSVRNAKSHSWISLLSKPPNLIKLSEISTLWKCWEYSL